MKHVGCIGEGCPICPKLDLPGWEEVRANLMTEEEKDKVKKQVTWAYGVTTCSSRANDGMLRRTLDSLKLAGFDRPHLFVDGQQQPDGASYWQGLGQTLRYPAVRTAGNWTLALHELIIREPTMQRYAIFQDDLVAVKNLRQYLDSFKFPDKGYWNLYTFPQNERGLRGRGWGRAVGRGLSAVGLVFDREGAYRLLSDYQFVARPSNLNRGWRNVDGGIYEAMKRAGYQEFVHHPSLLMHTGDGHSTIGNAPHVKAVSFPGESFDAMSLLAIPEGQPVPSLPPVAAVAVKQEVVPHTDLSLPGWGDQVQTALTAVGITKERVEKWLGRPCACSERREKLNGLGQWVKRILSGKTEQGKEHLETLMGGEGK